MGNILENSQIHLTTTELNLPTQLQIMRCMGFIDETVNLVALQLSNDFESAIDLVLNGFTIDT